MVVALPRTACLFSCSRCETPGKSHLRLRPSNPSCTEGKASREKQTAGRGNPGFKGSRQVSEREGGVRVGMMEREGRRCPFKRRRPSGDLFSFPGRKAELGLGAQGGEVQGWAVERRSTLARIPPSRPLGGRGFAFSDPPPSWDPKS